MPRRANPLHAVLIVGYFAVFAQCALGSSIVLINPGFEATSTFSNNCCTPVQVWENSMPGWDITPGPQPIMTGGAYRPTLDPVNHVFIAPYEGLNVAYSNGATLSQTTTTMAIPGITYNVSVAIGRRAEAIQYPGNVVVPQNYSVQLWAGSTLLGQLVGNTISQAPGSWNVVTFKALNHSLANVPLKIVLTSAGPQVDFDSVSIYYIDTVPEPSTYVFMGSALLALAVWSRRRKRSSS